MSKEGVRAWAHPLFSSRWMPLSGGGHELDLPEDRAPVHGPRELCFVDSGTRPQIGRRAVVLVLVLVIVVVADRAGAAVVNAARAGAAVVARAVVAGGRAIVVVVLALDLG